ncbi:MAG: hypothetical protein U9P80_04105 [Thermodesulfobacteriota bacterium]|nr:hypothetical protein [Thermodesulfobacteriota bacterium]
MNLKTGIEGLTPWRIVFAVSMLSLCAVLPAWFNYDIIARDGAFQYIPAARLFMDRGFMAFSAVSQLPLFPMFLALVSGLTGLDLEMSGRLISALSFIVASLGIYMAAWTIFKDRWVALLSVLFLISNHELLTRSVDCLKESLLIMLVVWGNYFILRGIDQGFHRGLLFLLGIIVLFFGAIVRTTALFFLGAWVILWAFHKSKGMPLRVIVLSMPVIALGGLMILMPDLGLFHRKGFALIALFSGWPGLSAMSKAGLDTIVEFFATGNCLIMLFGFIGFFIHKKDLYYIHVCLVFLMYLLVLSMMGWTSDRYLLAPVMWFYPMAAYAVIRSLRSIKRPVRVLAILAIVSCPFMWAYMALTPPDADKLARRQAGEWILSRVGPGARIMTNRDRLAFYARGLYTPLADDMDKTDAMDKTDDMDKTDVMDNAGRQDKKALSYCMALDTLHEDGRDMKREMDNAGRQPDKTFRTIHVYLPMSGLPIPETPEQGF